MAYVLAVIAALLGAVGAVMQRIGVESAPADSSMRLSIIGHMFRRPIWFAGMGLLFVQFGCQAVALRLGSLTGVQPISVMELIFLMAILATRYRHPLGWRDWAAAALVVAGLATFVATAHPVARDTVPAGGRWLVLLSIDAVVVAGLVVAGRVGPRWWRAAALGTAAAVLFVLTAAFTKAMTTQLRHGWSVMFSNFEFYGLLAAGALGLFLLQNALHAGPVAASRALLVTVNPLLSVVIGAVMFGDTLHAGTAAVAIEVVAFAVMCAGIVVLCGSPVISGEQAGEHEMLGRRAPADVLEAPAGEPA